MITDGENGYPEENNYGENGYPEENNYGENGYKDESYMILMIK